MKRPFLRWAGGKYLILNQILMHLPKAKRLVEPFVGSGTVFLNTDYPNYLLADSNSDLINVFTMLQKHKKKFIDYCKPLFESDANTKKKYYQNRDAFNTTNDIKLKAALFIYLNRHGFNGLCRYNSKGKFNVPFGKLRHPELPIHRMLEFKDKSINAEFISQDFHHTFKQLKKGDVVYCDPPYVPLSETSNFTAYDKLLFGRQQQLELMSAAKDAAKKGIPVIISNHDLPFTRELYKDAHIESFEVQRMISSNAQNRSRVKELVAVF